MEVAVSAASWVLGKALAPVTDGVLEAWAASAGLGPNIDALKMELLYAQGMLDNARGREIRSPALKELLHKLRQLAYDADDVLDELEYFRIQDELDGTYHAAAGEHDDGGCLRSHARNARHTARAICGCQGSSTRPPTTDPDDMDAHSGCIHKIASLARNATNIAVGKLLPCHSPSPHVQNKSNPDVPKSGLEYLVGSSKVPKKQIVGKAKKLKFHRVDISKRMKDIVEQLKPLCSKVSTILNLELLDSREKSSADAMIRPITSSEFIEPEFYGRTGETSKIIFDVIEGEYCDKALTVLPIVGPGGIGKTTLAQYIYKQLQNHFEVTIWKCVSVNFNVQRLTKEIAYDLINDTSIPDNQLTSKIEEKTKSAKFLLVLDDMWNCDDEDEWKRFLVPFTKGQTKGNLIIVTSRFPAVAQMVKTTNHWIDLEGLDSKAFKELFLAYVFDDSQSRNDHSDLLVIGDNIQKKLKGSPLAAKTVGRLLKSHLDLDHWTRVLESKEWESKKGIMPALKLSYDYLPFYLQQCFIYCALFPEDYKFKREELIHFWIGLDVLRLHGEHGRVEEIGQSHLTDMVNYGFLKKEEMTDGHTSYAIHDLLHELALKVQSHEIVSICSSNVNSTHIPPFVRHLSIIIDDKEFEDRMTLEQFKKDLNALGKRLTVENLRTLMLFGRHHGTFAKIFCDLFKDAYSLRTIFLCEANYNNVDVLLQNFSKLIHLRYIRITPYPFTRISLVIPIFTSRLYHMRILDIEKCIGHYRLPRDMNNLINIYHLLVSNRSQHSDIFEVGKLKLLRELRRFEVKKGMGNSVFELKQIGQLRELQELGIYNLQCVESEEANDAKLMDKHHLQELTLHWDNSRTNKDPMQEENILESLKPHSNLRKLSIIGNGGTKCPTWLEATIECLEYLRLDAVAWKKLPPLGEMWMLNNHSGYYDGQTFNKLKRLELVNIPNLKKWVGHDPCHLFSHLEVLIIIDCCELMELSFPHSTCCQHEQTANMTWFPRLQKLEIRNCAKLLSFPPVPWTCAPCIAEVAGVGSGCEELRYYCYNGESESILTIAGKDGQDVAMWNVLAFHNLIELKTLCIREKCPSMLLDHLQMLPSLKTLKIWHSSHIIWPVEGRSRVVCQFPVEHIEIASCGASGKELTELLACCQKLSVLRVFECERITGLGAVEEQVMAIQLPSSSSNKVDKEQWGQQQLQDTEEEEEITALAAEECVVLPPHLQDLEIRSCRLSLSCSSSSCSPFPSSLKKLVLHSVKGMETLAPFSNLTSLIELSIQGEGVTGVGLWPLLTQGHVTSLAVIGSPKFFIGAAESLQPDEEQLLSRSSELTDLTTDGLVGLFDAPICNLLFSSLTSLCLERIEVERFTREQEEALKLLSSLQDLQFMFASKLKCLPTGLHRLRSLKQLYLVNCPAILSLPKDLRHSSLEDLSIWDCGAIQSLPKDVLPSSLKVLRIMSCPAIQLLPKVENLPSSLRELDVSQSDSQALKQQCRKFIGKIPVVEC